MMMRRSIRINNIDVCNVVSRHTTDIETIRWMQKMFEIDDKDGFIVSAITITTTDDGDEHQIWKVDHVQYKGA